MDLTALKSRYTIVQAWRDLDLPGSPGKCVRSPFREDRSPSFSVYDDGQRFKDFATGESGDMFDFIAKAHGCSTADAIAWVRDRAGVSRRRNPAPPRSTSKIPRLRCGTEAEFDLLAEHRGFSKASLTAAQQRGFLFFAELWGHVAWCITDSRRELFEFRRVDGEMWPAYGRLPARKCHCLGTGKRWPIGTVESISFPRVAWVEGGPDFLALLHFLHVERKAERVAPVGVLGASNHALAPEALSHFKGKLVCLYPHADEAGRSAVRAWARQLHEAGATRVRAFDLSRLVKADGTEGKDLADVCHISADCFEREGKFREVMP